MPSQLARPISGHVLRVERQRGPVWYAKYRLPDGRQVQKKLGPAWTKRCRPSDGYLTRDPARPARGDGPHWRDLSTGSRRVLALLPAFGAMPVESITTPMVESWMTGLEVAPATRTKAYVLMGGIMKRARKVYGLCLQERRD